MSQLKAILNDKKTSQHLVTSLNEPVAGEEQNVMENECRITNNKASLIGVSIQVNF